MGLALKAFKLTSNTSEGVAFKGADVRFIRQGQYDKVPVPNAVSRFLEEQGGTALYKITFRESGKTAWGVMASDPVDAFMYDRLSLFTGRKGRDIGSIPIRTLDSFQD